jgi:hypothetical protein
MQQRSHPFFSRIGCAAALILALALALLVRVRGGMPFSPGRLAAAQPSEFAVVIESEFASHAEFEADCERCHAPWRGIEAARCEQCHQDVARQRLGDPGLHRHFFDAERCALCHTDHRGASASLTTISADLFDHDRTTFSLARHQQDYDGSRLACRECHLSGGYTAATADCTTCHEDAAPAFVAEHTALFGPDCIACHDGLDSMIGFDHGTVFPLDGAHAALSCTTCHVDRVFAGTPDSCVGCHEEPAVHAGLFGLDCARCHTTGAWQPAALTHHTFPLDHGESGTLACQSCHESSYTVYTCYNCHEHDPGEIAEEHREEGIFDFADCVECHPTGREDEDEGRGDGDD